MPHGSSGKGFMGSPTIKPMVWAMLMCPEVQGFGSVPSAQQAGSQTAYIEDAATRAVRLHMCMKNASIEARAAAFSHSLATHSESV